MGATVPAMGRAVSACGQSDMPDGAAKRDRPRRWRRISPFQYASTALSVAREMFHDHCRLSARMLDCGHEEIDRPILQWRSVHQATKAGPRGKENPATKPLSVCPEEIRRSSAIGSLTGNSVLRRPKVAPSALLQRRVIWKDCSTRGAARCHKSLSCGCWPGRGSPSLETFLR